MFTKIRITRNAARCLKCMGEVESTFTHDFQECPCGNIFVDGGKSYLRRGYRDGLDTIEDLSVSVEVPDIPDDDDPYQQV